MQTELERQILERRKQSDILLMSHCVLGYKSIEDNHQLVAALSDAGVEIIELQFPFSEPIADGPVLLRANHEAVASGITTKECFALAAEITACHPQTLFVIMTYFNIVFRCGIENFMEEAKRVGVKGIIVPDLPIEEAEELLAAGEKSGVAPILLVTPATSKERLAKIGAAARGMIYCVARKGVTGSHTLFSPEFHEYLARVREASSLPLGVGFGVQSAEDVEQLAKHADIAIVCTKVIQAYAEQGVDTAADLVRGLRPRETGLRK